MRTPGVGLGGELRERGVEAVEHREQLLDERLARPLDDRRLALHRLLPVVLEVGLDLLGERAHLVALAQQPVEVALERRRGIRLGVDDAVVVDTAGRAEARPRPSSRPGCFAGLVDDLRLGDLVVVNGVGRRPGSRRRRRPPRRSALAADAA